MATPAGLGSPTGVDEVLDLVHRLRPHALPDCSDLRFDEVIDLRFELAHERKRIDRLVDLADELVADRDPDNASLAASA
jgi:hypothetical protein